MTQAALAERARACRSGVVPRRVYRNGPRDANRGLVQTVMRVVESETGEATERARVVASLKDEYEHAIAAGAWLKPEVEHLVRMILAQCGASSGDRLNIPATGPYGGSSVVVS